MNCINILTHLLVKAYYAEARRHHKQAQKSEAARIAFKEEAEEYRRRAEEADLAAAECLSAKLDSCNMRNANYNKAYAVEERLFTV